MRGRKQKLDVLWPISAVVPRELCFLSRDPDSVTRDRDPDFLSRDPELQSRHPEIKYATHVALISHPPYLCLYTMIFSFEITCELASIIPYLPY